MYKKALILAVMAVLACTACGEMPQPFRDAPRATTDNPLLDVPSAVGVAILPVTGVPAPLNREIARAMATRLLALEIPAEAVDSNAGLGFTLAAEAQDIVVSPSGVTATLAWSLRSRRGVAGNFRQAVTVPAAAWQESSPDTSQTATEIAGAAGTAIVAMVGGEAPVQAAVVKTRLPRIAIAPVDGAPGDGRDSLRLALIQIMFERGVARDESNPEVTLHAAMTSETVPGDQQKVEIVWHAIARDGKDLGTVKLNNTIPTGALDGPWGPTAFAIANAAAGDLVALLGSAAATP